MGKEFRWGVRPNARHIRFPPPDRNNRNSLHNRQTELDLPVQPQLKTCSTAVHSRTNSPIALRSFASAWFHFTAAVSISPCDFTRSNFAFVSSADTG